MSWMPGDVSASSVRIGRRWFVTNCSPTAGKSLPTHTRVCWALWYSLVSPAQNAKTSATWPPRGSITRMRSPRCSPIACPSRAGTGMVVASGNVSVGQVGPEIRRRGWPFVPRPKELSSCLYSSSARLRPTRLPSTAQWSRYGTAPPVATRNFTQFAMFRGLVRVGVPGTSRHRAPAHSPRGPPAPDQKDSPSWLAFRPPAERAFESPLQLLRPASTYSAARDGAVVKLRHGATLCNPKVHALCGVEAATFAGASIAAHARVHRERHGGRRRHHELERSRRGRPALRGGPHPLHGGDQRGRPRRPGRRGDRGRRHGLPRRRRRAVVQLASARPARRRLRVRRPAR